MSPLVITTTREELLRRREDVLSRLGLTREELQQRADQYLLSGDEWAAVDEIADIEFLLGARE